ncbi:MAG: selenium metabolism-associated LysR family transcriptional regulator [Methylocystaceae bacterium]
MNLSLLETYIKVVEYHNLSRAAQDLNLSQPAVSKQIQSLEEQFGTLLLERCGRRLRTTEAGEALLYAARDVIKSVERMKTTMEEMAEAGVGTLHLGASSIPGQYLLPPVIKSFKEKYPQIGLYLEVSDTEKIGAQILARELDLGVVGAQMDNRKLDSFAWKEDHLLVAAPNGHHLASQAISTLEQLCDEPWIFREKGSGTRQLMEDLLLAAGLKKDNLSVVAELGSTEAVLAAVEAGMGISLVSNWAAQRAADSGRVITLKVDHIKQTRSFYVIYPKQKNRRPVVQLFIEHLQSLSDN